MPEKLGYKHLETDDEFVARVQSKHPWWANYFATGETLDNTVWNAFKMQRKIVEVFE
jgi:hypothetical protein